MNVLKIVAVLSMLFAFSLPASAGIPLFSTGASEEERGPHNEYSLKLVFFQKGGGYVGLIDVQLFDSKGNKIVETRSKGPWLFVDLESGSYTVRAQRQNGEVQSTKFNIEGKGQKNVSLCFEMCE